MSSEPDGSWTLVTMLGELDFVSGDQIRTQLSNALATSTSGVELDLSGLSFCDCAGLSVLLELRHRALAQGKTVTIRAADPAFDRLLHLIGAHELFPRPQSRGPQPHAHRPKSSPKLVSLS
ncbi:STAS domain-containing protein [Streptomyces sp. NPDC096032]|uniref:STAS domain-containing protein n=1 Tax=Streptomyces sp. NPDC096032 TaxID=3366070 RepID=UPI0037FD79BC